jgi:hypothetical protein
MTYRPNKPKRNRYKRGPVVEPEPTKQESKETAVSEMTKEEKQRLLDLFMAREDLEGTDALVKSWIGNGLRLQAESDAKLKEWDERRKQLDQERQALIANFNATDIERQQLQKKMAQAIISMHIKNDSNKAIDLIIEINQGNVTLKK